MKTKKTIIAMGGEPATGKSTIVKKILKKAVWEYNEPEKLVMTHYSSTHHLHIIGNYLDESHKFPGTDRLSMAVQPQAAKFIKADPSHFLFEGDRLFNASLLEEIAYLADHDLIEFHILIVTADKTIKEQRHIERADTQEEQFKKSKETKTERILSNFMLMDYIKVVQNNTPEDLDRIVNEIWGNFTNEA